MVAVLFQAKRVDIRTIKCSAVMLQRCVVHAGTHPRHSMMGVDFLSDERLRCATVKKQLQMIAMPDFGLSSGRQALQIDGILFHKVFFFYFNQRSTRFFFQEIKS